MLRTPLYDRHAAAGATFTGFAGYEMPVHFGSIKDEHATVRDAVGMFDVSHMSDLWISGPDAAGAISAVCPFDAAGLEDGRGKYTVLLRGDGTILDDTFVFRVGDTFHMVPNAGQNEAAADHMRAHGSGDLKVADASRDTAILAVQGPQARGVVDTVLDGDLPRFHRMVAGRIADVEVAVAGTGYTGEKGVEVFAPAQGAVAVWDAIMAAGEDAGIRPIGLGARDTLRLEKGYCLAGNEFAGGRTPLEAALDWLIDWDHDFLGKGALLRQREAGHARLSGLLMERGVPRTGYRVEADGLDVGVVSSGTQSPSLGKGIALAYLDGPSAGDAVQVRIRDRAFDATVAAPPFV